MKGTFRQSMDWLHGWSGLLLGGVLYFVFLTGTAGYADLELDRWMMPERPNVADVETAISVATAQAYLSKYAADADSWFINPPGQRENPYLRVIWADRTNPGTGSRHTKFLDPITGEELVGRDTGGGQFLYRLHYKLHYMPVIAGIIIVGVATMFMLVSLVSGVITHKRIFRDFFTFRPGASQRAWLDAHNVLSVLTLPFQIMITYSGLVFLAIYYMPLIVAGFYAGSDDPMQQYESEQYQKSAPLERSGTPVPPIDFTPMITAAESRWGEETIRSISIDFPGDTARHITFAHHIRAPVNSAELLHFNADTGRLTGTTPRVTNAARGTFDGFLGLHEGLFATPLVRWLYILSGLAGAAMVSSGLILWTVKRRQNRRRRDQPERDIEIVDRLNVAIVCGLPVALAAYFWANRLIPTDFAERAAWEGHAIFIVWGLMAIHALNFPAKRGWYLQCGFAAFAFGSIPIINLISTNRHLIASISQQQWDLAAVDITFILFGFGFAAASLQLRARVNRRPIAAPCEVSG